MCWLLMGVRSVRAAVVVLFGNLQCVWYGDLGAGSAGRPVRAGSAGRPERAAGAAVDSDQRPDRIPGDPGASWLASTSYIVCQSSTKEKKKEKEKKKNEKNNKESNNRLSKTTNKNKAKRDLSCASLTGCARVAHPVHPRVSVLLVLFVCLNNSKKKKKKAKTN